MQRIDLGASDTASALTIAPSPDTTGATWRIAADGKGIDFGKPKQSPLLSLACQISAKAAPQLAVIRHAQSEPGAKALFAVLGNGMTARLKLDAKLAPEGWRWVGTYPADAPELDVFTGQHDIEATLPGAGTLRIAGADLPREFLGWCRRGGAQAPVAKPAISPAPAAEDSTG